MSLDSAASNPPPRHSPCTSEIGGDRQSVRAVVVVQNIDAGGAVLDQAGAVPCLDQAEEQIEIAAEIEHPGDAGASTVYSIGMADFRPACLRIADEAVAAAR